MRSMVMVGIMSLVLGACAVPSMHYTMPLVQVERPADAEQQYGPVELTEADSGFVFSDSLVRMAVVALEGSFAVTVTNRSAHTITFEWGSAAYVDRDGVASPVVSGETRCMDAGRSVPPAHPIPRGATAVLQIIPTSHVHTGLGCWVSGFVSRGDSARTAELEGREIRLTMPFRIRETINEYTLVFRLQGVRFGMREEERPEP